MIQRVLVIGAGTSGQQVALQFARFGYDVVVYDLDQERLDKCWREQRKILRALVAQTVVRQSQVEGILARITLTTDAAGAAADIDLVSESVPENLGLKREVFARFHPLCKPSAVFTTNSSYLLPSRLATASGRPERFAAFHFHVPVWHANAVDVMPHARTLPEVVETLCQLAWRIGQVPIQSKRENPGYVFNAMLHPLLVSALDLAARGVVDFEDVDRAWMAVTKMPIGPFGIVDKIGLDTVHEILGQWGKLIGSPQLKGAGALLKCHLDRACYGEKSGRGFYCYPHPAYAQPSFLAPQEPASAEVPGPGATTERFVPSAVPAPVDPLVRHQVRLYGGVVLLGSDAAADCLQRRLRQIGADVHRVPDWARAGDIAQWLERRWGATPLPHLCLVAGAEAETPGAAGRESWFQQRLELPFLLTQCWFRLVDEAGLCRRATLTGICRMGGTLGFEAAVEQPDGGALAGLIKSVSMESMQRDGVGIRAKVVDFDAQTDPERCADLALQEWALGQAGTAIGDLEECLRRHAAIEIGYAGQERHTIRYRTAPPVGPLAAAPSGVWLVSGGARGITMLAAVALARRYGLELHLLGRTALPTTDYLSWSPEQIEELRLDVMRAAYRHKEKPNLAWERYAGGIEIQRALRRCQSEGIRAAYHACDVADSRAVAQVVSRVRAAGKAVSGVLHGAGVEQTARLETKTRESFRATVAPKSLGTLALIEATAEEPLRWFVAFGSLAGRFGGIGQADYAMANEILAKQVGLLRRRRPDCRCVTIHWPGWEGTGMAARPESRFLLEKAAHRLMPVAEGIRHFLREIELGAPVPEVVIVSPRELQRCFLVESEGTLQPARRST